MRGVVAIGGRQVVAGYSQRGAHLGSGRPSRLLLASRAADAADRG